ncbi:hypothetical protein SAMN05428978_11114 [Nitrosomonas sp. Nm34]|nr:hypothetical protein SAMN05428978_11114 [Nitrosomonas sp. Nm34]
MSGLDENSFRIILNWLGYRKKRTMMGLNNLNCDQLTASSPANKSFLYHCAACLGDGWSPLLSAYPKTHKFDKEQKVPFNFRNEVFHEIGKNRPYWLIFTYF